MVAMASGIRTRRSGSRTRSPQRRGITTAAAGDDAGIARASAARCPARTRPMPSSAAPARRPGRCRAAIGRAALRPPRSTVSSRTTSRRCCRTLATVRPTASGCHATSSKAFVATSTAVSSPAASRASRARRAATRCSSRSRARLADCARRATAAAWPTAPRTLWIACCADRQLPAMDAVVSALAPHPPAPRSDAGLRAADDVRAQRVRRPPPSGAPPRRPARRGGRGDRRATLRFVRQCQPRPSIP